MKLAVLFSGGKDSTLAAWLAIREGYEVCCLISIESENPESFMFHTPSIQKTRAQAEAMGIPLITQITKGEKEVELEDLKLAIEQAREHYGIEGVVTGAVESVYQATRIQKICNGLEIEVFNPLWQKPQEEILHDLIERGFEVIVVGVFAHSLDEKWIGRKIDVEFLDDLKQLNEEWGINIAGEGGEYETFVVNGPLFKKGLEVKDIKIDGAGNSWTGEVVL